MKINSDSKIASSLEVIAGSTTDLQIHWIEYLQYSYEDKDNLVRRSLFEDATEIALYIVKKFQKDDITEFEKLFNTFESIFITNDEEIKDFITIGLFESIFKNKQIDFYHGFDKWIKPKTRVYWEQGIEYWYGNDWKNKNV